MFRKLLLILLILTVGTVGVLWLGAYSSLDHTHQHADATQRLPIFSSTSGQSASPELVRIQTDGFEFRARVAGFRGSRGNVMLLHGFPESSHMYESTLRVLAEAGYAAVAFDQRGYSPGARPEAVADYQANALIADVHAVAHAVGFDSFHLVGHDWGAAIGWLLVMADATNVNSWSALSIPHMAAYQAAVANDPDQRQRSRYVQFFRTPWLPETLFAFNNFNLMRNSIYQEHNAATVTEYLQLFSEPGALTAALNWYRAVDLGNSNSNADPSIDIPVLFVWGTNDPVVGQAALQAQRPLMSGPFREIELDTGHWLLETRAEAVNAAILGHLDSVSRPEDLQSP